MNIAFVSSGNSIHVKKIANALAVMGHQITLFTLPDYNKLLADFDERVKIVKLPVAGKKGYYLNARFLRNALKKENYDLVNAHYASGCGTLARLANVHPLALAVFGSDVYDYPYASKSNMRRVIKNLDAAEVITSTSHVMAQKVREFYHKEKPMFITPFGVDLEHFYPREVKKDGTFEFGIVKKIEHKYGIDILLHAFKGFCREMPDCKVRLVIYGRGSATEEYREMTRKLQLEDKVAFQGFVQNERVPEVLSHMDAACFPSVLDSESFGVAAVEAMACGIPVIASDASGFTEVVEDGVTGLIVPKKDIDALKNAMIKLYTMPEKERRAMGMAGCERVKRLYNFEDNMKEYERAMLHAVNQS